ncbi:MAG: AMP-binding protein [Muribaculaceae bacterium]|nr:AMP-binding protein [Muribaculaceae bacterium]
MKRIHGCTPEALEFISQWFDDSPFVTAHTSGSTGAPKEIQLLKSDMRTSALSTNRYFNITEQSTLVCPLSAGYIAGKMMIVRAIISGAELWMEKPSNKPMTRDYGHVDLIAVVPSQVPHLLSNPENRLIPENILIGGTPLPGDIASEIIAKGFNAFVSYGMTETCSHVALRKVDNSSREVYEALNDIHFSTDMRNCLVIKSESRFFKQLATNDIVKLLDDRHFTWLGRYDNVINSGGIKIYPEEIEQLIRDVIPSEIEYYIAKDTDDKWGEAPVLVISEKVDDMESLLSEVRAKVRSKAQRPVKIIVDTIEHTSSGKIVRRSIKNQ